MKDKIKSFVVKLHHLISITDSENAKNAYIYSINELGAIIETESPYEDITVKGKVNKWEYKHVESGDWKEIEDVCNKQGAEGWELYLLESGHCFFKRQVK